MSPNDYKPDLAFRDRSAIMRELAGALGGFDGDGYDAVARNTASLITLLRLNLEVLIDVRDLIARSRRDDESDVSWERRSGYRKGESYRGV